MNAQKAFKMYFGINLHFTSLKYSILTYGTNTKSAQSKFDSLTQEQTYRFIWLGDRFKDVQALVYACIGCQFADVDMRYGNKDEIVDAYLKFKSRRESMTYTIKGDINRHIDNQLPLNKLIFKYLIGEYSPEYMLLLSYETDQIQQLYESQNLSWARDKILKLIKYAPFFNTTKYIHLIEHHAHHVTAE